MSRNNNTNKRIRLTRDHFAGRMRYFFSRAMANVRQNLFIHVVSSGTIALALLIFSLFLLVYVNLEGAAEDWSKKVQVTAYFDQEVSRPDLELLKSRVKAIAGTDSLTYISKDEAVTRFRSRLKGQEALLAGVSADILPASLEIGLKKESRNSEAIEVYVARLKTVPGITDIQYGEEWVRKFNNLLNFARLVGALLGAFIFIAVVFIVSNTIKLTVYSRKDEIELLSLVGATRMFIKAPFLIEGTLQGLVGSGVALVTLGIVYLAFLNNAGNFLALDPANSGLTFLPLSFIAGIFLGGVLLGFLGSLTSLRRFINV